MPDLLDRKAALVIAHPGHELRVHHWLECAKPMTFVLTDGSGRSTVSRLPSTTQILQRAQATPGSIYGRFSDRQIYTALLQHNTELFAAAVEELATAFVEHAIEYVVGDALEGYNPGHDVCRLLINAAVARANYSRKQSIANFCFSLVNLPSAYPQQPVSGAPLKALTVSLQLDDSALARKLAAAQAYAELAQEVNAAIQQMGLRAFQVEQLHPVSQTEAILLYGAEPQFYERYGEQQVALGFYQHVIRCREHLYPLAEALHQCAMA
ncbi:MAG: hypothetical protein KME45_17030 [Stenomitos rutilans HA7619-LM2]|jgi:AcrR family transcriptional regulator|nr:hypothetical protein [Stenomitos rutilans HA7619-LM2]